MYQVDAEQAYLYHVHSCGRKQHVHWRQGHCPLNLYLLKVSGYQNTKPKAQPAVNED
jgi:hypothetical protein